MVHSQQCGFIYVVVLLWKHATLSQKSAHDGLIVYTSQTQVRTLGRCC